jgi:hypothetical protein
MDWGMNRKILSLVYLVLFTESVNGQTEILPDPTRPVGYNDMLVVPEMPDELVDWKVTAIRISGAERTAIVNNRLVRVGEIIGQAKVLEISADGVTLNHNNQSLKIRLYSETSIKHPVNNKDKN